MNYHLVVVDCRGRYRRQELESPSLNRRRSIAYERRQDSTRKMDHRYQYDHCLRPSERCFHCRAAHCRSHLILGDDQSHLLLAGDRSYRLERIHCHERREQVRTNLRRYELWPEERQRMRVHPSHFHLTKLVREASRLG